MIKSHFTNPLFIAVPSASLLLAVLILIPGCVDEHSLFDPEVQLSEDEIVLQGDEVTTIYELTVLEPGVRGVDINDLGQVVGWSGDFESREAFFWDGNITILESLNDIDGVRAESINNIGNIVGTGWTNYQEDETDFIYYPVYWSAPNSSPTELPRLDGYEGTTAIAINDNGIIAGTAWVSSGDGQIMQGRRAVTWEYNDDGYEISELEVPDNYERCGAYGINADGNVVGVCSVDDGFDREPIIWSADGAVIHMVGINPTSMNFGFNDDNRVVGNYYDQQNNLIGFLWDDGDVTDLFPFNGRNPRVFPQEINNESIIVGNVIDRYSRAVVWYDTNDYFEIEELPLSSLPGSTESRAVSINENGKILGWVSHNSFGEQAVLWIPVEKDDDDPDDPEPGDGEKLFVSNIDHREQGPHLRVTITVVDEYDQPVGGVSV